MGRTISQSIDALRVETFSSSACKCAVAETKGRRKEHEDAHAVRCTDRGADFWVLDGHRGVEASAFGADILPREFDIAAKSGRLPSNGQIQQKFRTVDNRLRKHLKDKGTSGGQCGSTVVGALVVREGNGSYSAKVINCGDSRGIIIKDPENQQNEPNNGQSPAVFQTVDHKPDHPEEKKRVRAAGGVISKGRCPRIDGKLAVSRSIGDFDFKADKGKQAAQQKVSCEPDVYEVTGLQPGTFFLLACDGVWDVMTSEMVASMVHELIKSDPQADIGNIASLIVRECFNRGSSDNLTVLIARLTGGPCADPPADVSAEVAVESGCVDGGECGVS
mmetsp:Transcript_116510/g.228605  ORF Transcript_116510/g.228605 Transcript_116510/m.228605 type:complete len:333 (-) Transcript_116510:50-1048(-)